MTPVTGVVPINEISLRLAEIALIRLNRGAASEVKLTMMMSFTFKDPNVLPAHVSVYTPPEAALMLTSSPIPSSFITFDCKTKSPEKSAPDINVSS